VQVEVEGCEANDMYCMGMRSRDRFTDLDDLLR